MNINLPEAKILRVLCHQKNAWPIFLSAIFVLKYSIGDLISNYLVFDCQLEPQFLLSSLNN